MDSEVLDNIHEQFIDMIFKHGIRIHSFQEGRGISGIKGLNGKVRCLHMLSVIILIYMENSGSQRFLVEARFAYDRESREY